MNSANVQALADLRDIHLPGAVTLWPLAPGWWLILGGLLALALGVHLVLRARRRSLKRAAVRELDGIEASFRRSGDVARLALSLATLLRRVAIARFPRRDVASLHGRDWSRFLVATSGDRGLTPKLVHDLSLAVYAGPSADLDGSRGEAWTTAARNWIRGNA
jgi:hypothetical protein